MVFLCQRRLGNGGNHTGHYREGILSANYHIGGTSVSFYSLVRLGDFAQAWGTCGVR